MNPYVRRNVAELSAYVPGEQTDDPAYIKLNTNENPYPPSEATQRVLQEAVSNTLRLYPDPVCRRLREAIARVHGCAVEQVFCGNGSDEVLALCIRAFVPERGRIGFFDPSYSLYPILADIADVGVAPLALNEDFSWPAIPERYDVPLFFWTNPNAPTSMLAPMDPIRVFAERSEGVVVVDEAYVDFADAHGMELAKELPNVLVTRTFSKSYSLAGIRLGYAVGHEGLIAALFKIKDAYNVNALTQTIGRAAVEDQAHMKANVQRIRATRERVGKALAEAGFYVAPSQANFLWVKPRKGTATELFVQLRERRILVRYFTAPRTRDYLRITIGTDAEMDALLSAIIELQ